MISIMKHKTKDLAATLEERGLQITATLFVDTEVSTSAHDLLVGAHWLLSHPSFNESFCQITIPLKVRSLCNCI